MVELFIPVQKPPVAKGILPRLIARLHLAWTVFRGISMRRPQHLLVAYLARRGYALARVTPYPHNPLWPEQLDIGAMRKALDTHTQIAGAGEPIQTIT